MAAVTSADMDTARDAAKAAGLALRASWTRLVNAWLYTPAGLFIVLLYCWGVDSVIQKTGVSFPASVACMILLFLFLSVFSAVFGEKKMRGVVKLVDVPAGFALRWINVFFVPSFVTLPLSPSIGGAEIGKIIAVFFIGFIIALTLCAYMVRGLQLLLGTSKRLSEDVPEDIDRELDPQATIPLTNLTPSSEVADPITSLAPPSPTAEPTRVRGPGPELAFVVESQISVQQQRIPPTRAESWAAFLALHLDTITYFILFLASLPVLYTTRYQMPTHLTLTVLSFKAALSLPPKFRRVLHPVLGCAALTLLFIYLVSLTLHDTFLACIRAYSTKTRYLSLFRGQTPSLPLPGAGDMFASILDASIVALAVPMYTHRRALRTHIVPILLPCITTAVASVLLYPLACAHVGIAPTRALAFTSRSLTLALATPAVDNFGGELNLTAVLCIMSGIFGVLIGGPVLRWLRVPEGDFVTRGVALGVNSSAVSTAALLQTDPRAAAMSSLALVVFGTVVVVLSAVGGMVEVVRGLAGA